MKNKELLDQMIDEKLFRILDYSKSIDSEKYVNYFKDIKHNYPFLEFNHEVVNVLFNIFAYDIYSENLNPKSFIDTLCSYMRFFKNAQISIDDSPELLIRKMKGFKQSKDKKNYSCTLTENFIECYDYLKNCGDIIKRDYWYIDELGLSNDRINVAYGDSSFNFSTVYDEENKTCLKKYMYYRIFNTDTAFGTMRREHSILKTILNSIGVPYKDVDEKTLRMYFLTLENKTTAGCYYRTLKSFSDYLLESDLINDSPIYKLYQLGQTGSYKYKATAPDDYIVSQIFENLDKVSPETRLWFLIIKCIGCRACEACQIKKDCLEVKSDGKGDYIYTIKLYSPKMKKDVANIIPQNLYTYIKEFIELHPSDSPFLFPPTRKAEGCINVKSMTKKFSKELNNLGIKNLDGTSYIFSAHSFRHLMAVKLKENDVPLQFIQEQLHHESAEMTLAYMEYTTKQLIKKTDTFFDINGDIVPIEADIELSDDEKYVEYMNKYINARTLINGICARSAKLGPCTHANACLECSNFRTSIDYLPALKKQLDKTETFLKIATENNWLPQIKTSEEDIKKLKKVIFAVENNTQNIFEERNTLANETSNASTK